MAVLLRSRDELPGVLAAFYALGARRNGWLWFGSLPGQAAHDRWMLIAAGLDVETLEARGQLTISELDLSVSPEAFVDPWVSRLEEALAAGHEALWFARFPIEPGSDAVTAVLPFERAWMDRFAGRRTVTLCPYIAEADAIARERSVAAAHTLIGEIRGSVIAAR